MAVGTLEIKKHCFSDFGSKNQYKAKIMPILPFHGRWDTQGGFLIA